MENIDHIFKSFYGRYNRTTICAAYNSLPKKTYLLELYKKVPFSVEIRMKNDVLAMQLNTQNIVSMELMTVIGYFFDNYNEAKRCVWTRNKWIMQNFFKEGITCFIRFGGEIHLNLQQEHIEELVKSLEAPETDEAVHRKLVEEFKLLESKNWYEFEKYIRDKVKKENEERRIEELTCMDLPLDWSNAFATDERATGVIAESPADGLVLSLNNLGYVDIEYISQITGADYKAVISALKGSVYQNPDTWDECFYKGWETADEYLSGRVVEKWEKAREANRTYKGYFEENVRALEKVLPKSISTEDIYITLGSPWIPADVVQDFIKHLLYSKNAFYLNTFSECSVWHDESAGKWKIYNKSGYKGTVKSNSTYGTKRLEAIDIIDKTLNMKPVMVTDEKASKTSKSGKKRVINKAETILALEKQQKILEEFRKWVWSDKSRKERLQLMYEKKYCSSVIRHYDGSFLTFPEMNPDESLYDYQKNAVARIMFSPNTLLAHEVGAGKTYVMTAAGMEMRRIGISGKNLYVVPNNLVGQWEKVFLRLYPGAKLLCVSPSEFKKSKRERILEKIRDEDFDGIIMAQSCFERIPVSKEYYIEDLKSQIAEIDKIKTRTPSEVLGMNRKKEGLQKALDELKKTVEDSYDVIYFDELGINTLFLDEAHNYKNVPVVTQVKNVLGLSTTGSEKCSKMMDKVKIVQKNNNGRGVVFATGTPVTNSLTDIYVMQKYLQGGELAVLGLQSFDSWIGMFAEKEESFEIDVDTSNYRMATRFSKYHNMPELSNLLAAITDFYQVDKTNGIPEVDGYSDVVVAKTPDFAAYLKGISDRADNVRGGCVDRKTDNMLKITTDGRKAALDLRLVDGNAAFTYQSKVAHCAENVFDIYLKTMAQKSAQLVFCDTSTPKDGFNMYDELKDLLVKMGIPDSEIAFIHSAVTESRRSELFSKVRKGEIRVLIGSTFKLGLGVNVQDKLIALHHLDVPWRPADMVQREGRILRKGNENKKVEIFRYITDGSFDAYSWQLLETKQKMISSVLAGSMPERMCAEVDDAVLDYAEVKALAIGDPLIKQRVETANKLTRNLTLQRMFNEEKQALNLEKIELPHKLARQRSLIVRCEADIEHYNNVKREYKKNERADLRQLISKELSENTLSPEEKLICSYQGFDVVIPSNMSESKLFVYLQNQGRYYVEMSHSEGGILVRIDNFLDELDKHLEKLDDGLKKMIQREKDIKEELKKVDIYEDVINDLKQELEKIDKKLGVKQ